ncbi:MAG: cell division protein FtsA, partial [Flavobacterium sp.]|nr:cell division protein FtsA [Flavobacterium sp.]
SIGNNTQSAVRIDAVEAPKPAPRPPVYQAPVEEPRNEFEGEREEVAIKGESTGDKIKRSFFDRYVDKIKDFLDNAE